MKYLESQELSEYNCLLDSRDCGNSVINGKIEVYSCTRTDEDMKLSKELEQRLQLDKKIKKENHTNGYHVQAAKPIPAHKPTLSVAVKPVLSPVSPPNLVGIFGSPSPGKLTVTTTVTTTTPVHHVSTSPFGALSNSANRNTFVDLIACLNNSFSDFDFR
jgi:hypothetical protein